MEFKSTYLVAGSQFLPARSRAWEVSKGDTMHTHSFELRAEEGKPYHHCTNCGAEFGGSYTPEQLARLISIFGNCDLYDSEVDADEKLNRLFGLLEDRIR
jgi:hypothetical protein